MFLNTKIKNTSQGKHVSENIWRQLVSENSEVKNTVK